MKSILCVLTLCCFQKVECLVDVSKFVTMKDISEQCRRQVTPSVFIGKRVMVANSQTLLFTGLDLPYSCYITIRAEVGRTIVLVFELHSDKTNYCPPSEGQDGAVTVYDLAETFGGYWGVLPSFKPFSISEKFYTLGKDTGTIAVNDTDEDPMTTLPSKDINTEKIKLKLHEPLHVVYEVPLLNVTRKYVDTDKEFPGISDDDDLDSLDYEEIVLAPNETASANLMPILQYYKQRPQHNGGRGFLITDTRRNGSEYGNITEIDSQSQRYDININVEGFTLDPRLLYSYEERDIKKSPKYTAGVNKIMRYNTHKTPLFSAQSTIATSQKHLNNNDTWSHIEALLKNVTPKAVDPELIERKNQLESERLAALVEKLADWQQNYSKYLAPDSWNLNNNSFEPIKVSSEADKQSTRIPNSAGSAIQQITSLPNTTATIQSTERPILGLDLESTNGDIDENLVKILSSVLEDSYKDLISTESMEKTNRANNDPENVLQEVKNLDRSSTQETTQSTNSLTGNSQTTTIITEWTTNTLDNIKYAVTKMMENLLGVTTPEKNTKSYETVNLNDSETVISTAAGTISTSIISTSELMGSVVDRESWENVVQFAPKIAGLLTRPESPLVTRPMTNERTSGVTDSPKISKSINEAQPRGTRKRKRKKRSIQAIPVGNARPHLKTDNPYIETVTTSKKFFFNDMMDFAKLVEKQDDELYGHISLFDMKNLIGRKRLDLCDHISKKRVVHLFNSSRIVIALRNFTWSRLTVIATPVRTLTRSNVRCHTGNLECQVSGERVCVDEINACDGIPNCGIDDIYDEDRMKCKSNMSLQHGVYLAAFTFLAVLITLLYILYYWLKRCVPKVSEAFFVYTDGSENVLHLESVMRSPMQADDESGKPLPYQSHLYEPDLELVTSKLIKVKKSFYKRLISCCRKKSKKYNEYDISPEYNEPMNRMFSFPQIEIHNLANLRSEVAVQTGASLELSFMGNNYEKNSSVLNEKPGFLGLHAGRKSQSGSENHHIFSGEGLSIVKEEDVSLSQATEDSELSMLKFLKEARLSAQMWDEKEVLGIRSPPLRTSHARPSIEREITNTFYGISSPDSGTDYNDQDLQHVLSGENVESNLGQVSSTFSATEPIETTGKRLRFDEKTTTIPSDLTDKTESIVRTGVDLNNTSSGRDFMRFWGKKNKKK